MFRNLSQAMSTSKQLTKFQLIYHSKNIKFEIKKKKASEFQRSPTHFAGCYGHLSK